MATGLPDLAENGKARRDATARAGGYALTLLAAPLNACLLQALTQEATSLPQLREAAGSPPQTTVRKHLGAMVEAGIVSRERGGLPGGVVYELLKPGRDLAGVARVVETWLASSPKGPLELGTMAAKSATKALVEGWSATLLRALAARPLSLTQLDALISGISYPSLERRLVAMRMAGQVEATATSGRGTPYGVTQWLRRAVAPLVGAACWERRHLRDSTAPIGRIDIETAFLLAMPLLSLDPDLAGICQLGIETSGRREGRVVGVVVGIEEGRVSYTRARLEGEITAWATGSVGAWFRAIGGGQPSELEAGGDRELVGAVLDGLHASLVRPVVV